MGGQSAEEWWAGFQPRVLHADIYTIYAYHLLCAGHSSSICGHNSEQKQQKPVLQSLQFSGGEVVGVDNKPKRKTGKMLGSDRAMESKEAGTRSLGGGVGG